MYIRLHPVVIDTRESYASYLCLHPVTIVSCTDTHAVAKVQDQTFNYTADDECWWWMTDTDNDYVPPKLQQRLSDVLYQPLSV